MWEEQMVKGMGGIGKAEAEHGAWHVSGKREEGGCGRGLPYTSPLPGCSGTQRRQPEAPPRHSMYDVHSRRKDVCGLVPAEGLRQQRRKQHVNACLRHPLKVLQTPDKTGYYPHGSPGSLSKLHFFAGLITFRQGLLCDSVMKFVKNTHLAEHHTILSLLSSSKDVL